MAKSSSSGKNSANAANLTAAIGSGAETLSTVMTFIAGVNDQKKRAAFEQNFAALNYDQQSKLNQLLLEANSETERLSILSQALAATNVQRINNISNLYAEYEKKKRNQQLIIGGGILLVGLVAVVLIIKKT